MLCNLSQWDSFDPLGEVVNAHDDKFSFSRGNEKRAEKINPPLREGPRGLKGVQICGWLAVKVTVKLAAFTFLDKLQRVFLHRGPVIALAHDLEGQVFLPMCDPQISRWTSFKA
ncbi:hypothetical protein Nepgr_000977 [Nepenthes gracilis]|uniref:Uncharacterized protein n=1 Tax=Nepenthes gracilis TaxID=150966 RepID=A0AAD3P683_NEPGR|nr:hypothetical protein Nepgr_000977 [Nepenthes gracilis]